MMQHRPPCPNFFWDGLGDSPHGPPKGPDICLKSFIFKSPHLQPKEVRQHLRHRLRLPYLVQSREPIPEPIPEPEPTPEPIPEPEPEPTPAPPTEEGSHACPTNGTYDLYDAETGEHIASDVAEADLPAGAEIVAVDDPRCGPAPEPDPPTLPSDGGPVQEIPAPGPGAPPVQTQPLPTVPQARQVPGQGSFTSQFIPCGQQPPISVRSLRTETVPSRPDSWQDEWIRI